jgi:hypothetical protein
MTCFLIGLGGIQDYSDSFCLLENSQHRFDGSFQGLKSGDTGDAINMVGCVFCDTHQVIVRYSTENIRNLILPLAAVSMASDYAVIM